MEVHDNLQEVAEEGGGSSYDNRHKAHSVLS